MNQDKLKQEEYFLSVVPRSYLLGIINKKDFTEAKLKKMLETITKKKVIKVNSALDNLTMKELIELFIDYQLLTLNETKELYFQFRDNINPIFYLYKFQKDFELTLSELKKKLNELFKKLILNEDHEFIPLDNENNSNKKAVLPKYKDFHLINLKLLEENSILEVSFEYLERIDYISKSYIPKHVYTVKSGFFWVDKKNQLFIIKCKETTINEAIITTVEKFLKTKIWKFSLRKVVIDEIFDKREMIKNSLIASNPDLFESMIIKDVKFSEKARSDKFDFIIEYERRASSYRTSIRGFRSKIKVNIAQYGKISLVGKSIKIDRVREWLIEILLQILEIHENFIQTNDISAYIKANDFITRTNLYDDIRNNKARQKIFEMVEKIFYLKNNPQLGNVDFNFTMKLGYYFDGFLIPTPNLRCNRDECNMSLCCPQEGCESISFEIKKDIRKRRFYLKCSECNERLSEEAQLECVDDHFCQFKLDDSLDYIFHPSLKIELNKIFNDLDLGYSLNYDIELYYIHENRLYRKDRSEKLIYSWEELPAFRDIPKINELSNVIKEAQTRRITEILEKCSNRIGKCRNCHLNDEEENICLLKIFAKYSNGQAHPHTGTEFGDFDFPQQFSSGLENIIGIAKSYGKKPSKNAKKIFDVDFGLLTFKKNDRLLEQFIQLSMEDTVKFIMVVVGRVIDSGLKNALYELARWKKKKIVIISPKDLIPIFSYYFGTLVNS
ncbi:MAG: hypothetical protein GF311_23375 [Candidatus Lokiarchaeota archaeon]|nr:hypothetical protein [Candidatus Lokiarchaeota archaeon]